MIGSFLTSGLVMIFGYAYPAYECFKTVERNKPEIEQLRFWCQYWILVAVLAVFERIGDIFISWVPMYSEAKLAFYIYLWYPKTKGTMYVYASFLKPYIEKHEKDIDRHLIEFRTRAADMFVLYFQQVASYGQTRFFEILQFVASQPFPMPYQNQQGTKAARKPTVASNRQVPAMPQPLAEDPPSPISSTSSSQHEEDVEQEVSSSTAPASPVVHKSSNKLTSATARSIQPTPKKRAQYSNPEVANNSALKKSTTPAETPESTSESGDEVDIEQIEPAPSQEDKEKTSSPPQETVMEDAIRITRGRLRKSRPLANNDA